MRAGAPFAPASFGGRKWDRTEIARQRAPASHCRSGKKLKGLNVQEQDCYQAMYRQESVGDAKRMPGTTG